MYTDAPIALDNRLILGLAFFRGGMSPTKEIFQVSYREWKSQGEDIIRGKLATSHAPEQPLNAAALHDNAPTGNQAD